MTGKFRLIDTIRDGRVLRQTFARELGPAGCLVLVSTTVYQVTELSLPGQMISIAEMVSSAPIETITESLAYVPGVKIGQDGLMPLGMDTYAPSIPDDE